MQLHFTYTHKKISLSKKFDVVTRAEINAEALKGKKLRQCTQ